MPTEIKIILPATFEDDVLAGDENVANINYGDCDSDQPLNDSRSNPANDAKNSIKKTANERIRHSRTMNKFEGKNLLRHSQHSSSRASHITSSRTSIQSAPQQYFNGQFDQSHMMILKKQSPVRYAQKVNEWPKKSQEIQVSITGTYDIDREHHDIMLKALKAYSLHRSSDEGKRTPRRPGIRQVESVADDIKSGRCQSQPASARCFKLSQCRLRFHDDVDADDAMASVASGKGPLLSIKRSPLLHSPSPRVAPVPTLYSLEESDGLLVDAVGHVYRGNRVRPWTPQPMKLSEYLKLNKDKFHQADPLRSSEFQPPVRSSFPAEQVSRRRSVPGSHPSVRFVSSNMTDIPQSRTYQRRNRTTHLWTDGSQLMSQSLPTSSFLHQRYAGSSSSSPRSSRDTASEKSSPAASKPNNTRPSSSYSYDGGFFLGAHTGQAEYFVIHPDWVSEAVTIKKLSLGNKSSPTPPPPASKIANFKSGGSWSGRRCLSAPPAKRRNPITWDAVDSIDIGDKK